MQIETWSTAGLPTTSRFDAWSHALSATHLDWELIGHAKNFDADLTARAVGDMKLVGCRCDPCEGFRSPVQIERSGSDFVGILFELSGSELVRQGEREALLRPGDFVLWDSSRSMQFRVLEPLSKMTILVPKIVMQRFLPNLDQVAGMRVDGTESLGPLVGAHLRQLCAGLGTLEDEHLQMVIDMTMELVCAGIGARYGRGAEGRADKFSQVRRFILDHLADPDLSPTTIAASNSISLRYLHKLFAARGASVSRWILRQRLDRCRKALSSYGSDKSVTDVAFAWGFNDASHFSRTFKLEFGQTPRSVMNSAGGAER